MQRSVRQLPIGCDILVIGDSIIRNCTLNLSDLSSETLCFPGATVASLRTRLLHCFDSGFDSSVQYIFIHIGTNNLKNSFWEKDRKDFIQLFYTVRELFRSAHIIFSSILPRWDDDFLYEHSLIYNYNLEQLSLKLPDCTFSEFTSVFLEDDSLFKADGLHLNFAGSSELSCCFEFFIQEHYKPTCAINKSSWIPPELKKLYTPKPSKIKSAPSLRNSCYNNQKKNNRYTYRNQVSRHWKLGPSFSEDGFQTSTKSVKIKPLPPLPPHRHYPEYRTEALIPYVNLHVHVNHPLSSSVPLPSCTSKYVDRKRRRKRHHKRKKRKAEKINYDVIPVSIHNHDVQVHPAAGPSPPPPSKPRPTSLHLSARPNPSTFFAPTPLHLSAYTPFQPVPVLVDVEHFTAITMSPDRFHHSPRPPDNLHNSCCDCYHLACIYVSKPPDKFSPLHVPCQCLQFLPEVHMFYNSILLG
ncbi:uncharacterized protein LOC121408995 isoform X2 [Lytechinus variegatus]|uniref:uncharacterized protein LOC121408995 isoform X2 n=1 Tax=Lytechinus variegatus TaxID=7654 RepID=UPI001BB0F4B6|nr:uncharacterized protein LOC121408995 isoform X2 [Lytechinus variegatus]